MFSRRLAAVPVPTPFIVVKSALRMSVLSPAGSNIILIGHRDSVAALTLVEPGHGIETPQSIADAQQGTRQAGSKPERVAADLYWDWDIDGRNRIQSLHLEGTSSQ